MRGMVLAFLLLKSVTLQAQEIAVRSHKNPDVDFTRFRTYTWAAQVDQKQDDSFYFLNDLVMKADIRDAVRSEMETRGYRQDGTNPDLLVNFRVFIRPVNLRGYHGYGSSYWSQSEYDPSSDMTSYDVDAGTLILSMLDRKSGILVWQGFASGLSDTGEFTRNEKKIREAVNLLFEDYGIRVSEYTKR
jgi:hypothetical protein